MSEAQDAWRRVKAILRNAWDLPAEARIAYVTAASAGDDTLRREALSLLDSMEQADDWFEDPAPGSVGAVSGALAVPVAGIGTVLGCWRVVRELGHGGMGTVYLVEREGKDFTQYGALKVVRAFADEELLRRFRDERRILAGLDHPYITRVLDGGATDGGAPFVVMEYVEGTPIGAYCNDRRLDVSARLDLFRKVCAAVYHAHQRLVIHRDIKEHNILVTEDGTPKLLDFGIAKLLEVDGGSALTQWCAQTPESASPEQVLGRPITIATDIYSLGVLLYRLLTNCSPYRDAVAAEATLMRAICEAAPTPPSVAARAPAHSNGHIRRDLDLIVLKALHKEPERRYSSVEAFSDDVARYLANRPVHAVPDSWSYRAGKFLHRHHALSVAIATALLAILVAAGTALWQAHVARRERTMAQQRFEMARQLANSVIFDLNDTLEGVPGSLQARRFVVSKALAYLDQLGQQVGSDASLMEQVAAAYVRIGDSQGNPYHPNIGDPTGALSSYTRALELYRRIGANGPSRLVRLGMATAQEGLGDIHWSIGDFEHASNEYREARSLATRLVEEEPNRLEFELKEARTVYKIGQTRLRAGDLAGAALSFRESVSMADRSLRQHPGNLDVVRMLALGYGKLGDVANKQGDLPRALDLYARQVSLFETVVTRSPRPESTHLLFLAHDRVSESLAGLGRWTEAEVEARRALDLLQPAIHAAVGDTQASSDQGYAYLTLGDALAGQHRDGAAVDAYRTAIGAYRAALVTNPRYIENRRELGFCLARIGDLALRGGRAREAVASYLEAIKQLEPQDIRPEATDVLAGVYLRAGDAQKALDPHAPDVLAWYRKSAEAWTERSIRQPLSPAQRVLQREAGEKAEARPLTGAARY